MRVRARGAERLALLAYAWLAVFVVLPFVMVLKLSLSEVALSVPPYAPQLDLARGLSGLRDFLAGLDLDAYRRLVGDPVFLDAYLSSLGYAAVATAILLVVGYPMALAMASAPARLRPLLVAAVTLPFWTSLLIRIYAWTAILRPGGLLDAAAGALGLAPPGLLYSDTAVYIGLVYAYLPFMVLPLYAALEGRDATLTEAAADLGATPWRAFWSVTLPLSAPGVAAGAMLCLIPMVGEFVIPDLLGGSQTLMAGRLVWTEFFGNRDWPTASAAAAALLLTLVLPILLYQRLQERRR